MAPDRGGMVLSSVRKCLPLVLGALFAWMPAAQGMAAPEAEQPTPGACKAGHLFLTIDTGNMAGADHIAEVLRAEHVRVTFFIANEPTFRGDRALDPHWENYWRDRVAEGHVFGNHTWSHVGVRRMIGTKRVSGTDLDGKTVEFDHDSFCSDLTKVDERFQAITGRRLAPIWRAPAGRVFPRTLDWASSCGFAKHVGWTPNGFLGDELPSERFSNQVLLDQAFARVRDGDVLMMHLGIRSRKEPFAAAFRPLVAGLKQRGFCFDTVKP